MKLRVLIADDHAVVRHGLRQVLSFAPDLSVEAEARNGWEVIDRVKAGKLDVVLLDMNMPGPCGIELIKRLLAEAPDLPLLVLSMHADWQVAAQAIKAGASGYLTKDSEPELLIEGIRKVGSGANYIDPSLATHMVFHAGLVERGNSTNDLTERENQVFLGLVRGASLNDIAESLHLSAKTISTHKFRLMRKLGVSSFSELVRYAVRKGVIE